jgi:O-antigen/teichoic acid export membrane protein
MGQSLVVRGAKDEVGLAHHSRKALNHALALLVPGVIIVLITAPVILSVFGASYAAQGTVVLRYMALASLPTLYVTLVVSELRVQRRMLQVAIIMVSLATIVLGLSYLFIPTLGLAGIGIAWLVGEGSVALALVLVRRSSPRTSPSPQAGGIEMPLLVLPNASLIGKNSEPAFERQEP